VKEGQEGRKQIKEGRKTTGKVRSKMTEGGKDDAGI
jgi:hypothetical protein